jgi:hypothetical protein
MARQQHSIDDRGDAASALLCLSRGCTHASLGGSRCDCSVDSDWSCVFSVPSLPQTQTLLDTTLHGVPNDFTFQQSLDSATLTADPLVQSSLITSTADKIETPPGQCKESFDRCLEKRAVADHFEAKYFQAARWCYLTATKTELNWKAFRGMKSAKQLFDRIELVNGLKPDDRKIMRAYWVKWKSWFIFHCHKCCLTALWAVDYKQPNEDSGLQALVEAYAKMKRLEAHFIPQSRSAHELEGTDSGKEDTTFILNSGSSFSEMAQGTDLADSQLEIPTRNCLNSLTTCRYNWVSIGPEYFKVAEYFYRLVNKETEKLDWDFICSDLTKYRSCTTIFVNRTSDIKMSSVATFMAWVRYEIKTVHQGCPTLKWAQKREGAKVLKKPAAESSLAEAYQKVRGLYEGCTRDIGLPISPSSLQAPNSSTLSPALPQEM